MKTVRLLGFLLILSLSAAGMAQCGPVIGTFPYTEGFEADPAWTSGGIGNDWEWGTPAHPILNSAGEGTKSWCVGGLTGQFYEFDAQSWLMSPCFDFSTLDNPWISFKIFWEVERTYDGLVLQYSLNEGATWANVGAYNDPESCSDQNWYNTSSIINLDEANPKHGWSGRQGVTVGSCVGGQGSGGWITASHCMAALANEPSVRFRFLFGSGSTCNNYDGIAIDAVFIGEPPPPEVETAYLCDGPSIALSAEAPCADQLLWDFGDPGSGTANSGTGAAVSHGFVNAGTYTVTVTILSPCGPAYMETMTVTVLGVSIIGTDATCGQPNGSLEAFVTGSNGPFVFDWQPGGGTDPVYDGLAPGDYSLTVSGSDMCPISGTGSIGNVGSDLQLVISHTDVTCSGDSDGTATAVLSGGVATSFLWSPSGSDQATATGLPGGDHTVTVTSEDGCEASAAVIIGEPEALVVTIDPETGVCAGASVVLEPEVSGGTGPFDLVWSPSGPQVSPISTTDFQVTATDANGCLSNTATQTVNVSAAIEPTLNVDEPSGCSAHCVVFTPGPAGMNYAFDHGDGSSGTGSAHCYPRQGVFDVTLTVTDDIGCSGTAVFSALVEVWPTPVAGFIAPATVIVSDGPLRVIDASSGGTTWQWVLDGAEGDLSSSDPIVTFPAIDCYRLQQVVRNDFGCSDTAMAEVCVENEYALFAPNAFTPNGDGFNEVFGVVSSVRTPEFFAFRIFDRWGREVFTTSDPNEGWTGEKFENGVYAWNVELRDSEQKLRKASGHVVLLR